MLYLTHYHILYIHTCACIYTYYSDEKPLFPAPICEATGPVHETRVRATTHTHILPPPSPHPPSSEIMVDRQLTQTSHELAQAKQSLEKKDSLIQQLRVQINQMDTEIQQLQTTMNHRQTNTPATSTDFEREDNSWYL